MSNTLTEPIVDTGLDLDAILDDAPPEKVAHMIKRSGQLGAGALIVAASEAGMEIEALCGYKWVPKGHAPDDMTPCKTCVEIWGQMGGGAPS